MLFTNNYMHNYLFLLTSTRDFVENHSTIIALFYYFAGNKFKKYIPPVDFFSRGLYMFDIGQNDLAGAFYSKSEDQIIASIPTILLEFETGVKVCYFPTSLVDDFSIF